MARRGDEELARAAPSGGPAVRAVLFDLDGVLVESYEVWRRLLDAAARDLGYPPISRAEFHASWGQGVRADVERFFPRHDVAVLERYYREHFDEHLEHLRVAGEAPRVFAALRERALATGVVTNTPAPLARALVARAGVVPEVLVGGTDVARAKPAPDMVRRACTELGVAAPAALVVGDSRFDREAAAAAGARFAGLGTPGERRLERLGALLELDLVAPR